MTISVKQDIQSQAKTFYDRFTQEQTRTAQLSPQGQINAIIDLQPEAPLFTDLQKRVEKIAREHMQTALGFSDEEWDTLSNELTQSAGALEAIDENSDIAADYVMINLQVTDLQSQPNPDRNKIASLQEQIASIIARHTYTINFKNIEAFDGVSKTLEALTKPGAVTIQNRSDGPSSTPPNLSQNRRIKEIQDEEYNASLFTNQYDKLPAQLCNDPLKDFETVLAYYKGIKEYSLSKTSYLSVEAGVSIMGCLRKVEELLQGIIKLQTQNEQAQQAQAQPNQSQILKDLHRAVEQTRLAQAQMSDMKLPKDTMNEIFRKLSSEEKENLFQALNEIQKPKTQRDLSRALLGQDFAMWPATLTHKAQAIEERIEKMQSISNRPEASAIVKHADEMNLRFFAIKDQQPVAQTTRLMPSPPQSSIPLPPLPENDEDFIFIGNLSDPSTPRTQTNIPREWYLPSGVDIGSLHLEDVLPFEGNEPSILEVHPGNTLIIRDLQELLPLLQPNASADQLQNACLVLGMMDSKGVKSVFKMSGNHPRATADRPAHHLYFIHKNECQDMIIVDGQYGNKAFAGIYPATNEERSRAVQRTIVELALESLEDAINFEDSAILGKLLDILEGVKLDVKDRADGQENAAYNLFSAFYHLHIAARSNRPSLIDPHHAQFNGDFGRVAFYKIMQGIDPSIKIAAIDQVRNAFKAAWKLQ